MRIDWFTVAAQVVNFLILVWLLKRFLYKPILDAIDAREKRVAKRLADADSKQAEANQEHDAFQRKNEAFDRERDGLLSEAKDQVEAERKRLFDGARQDGVEQIARCRAALGLDTLHQPIQPLLVRTATQNRVVTLLSESFRGIAANTCPRAHY